MAMKKDKDIPSTSIEHEMKQIFTDFLISGDNEDDNFQA